MLTVIFIGSLSFQKPDSAPASVLTLILLNSACKYNKMAIFYCLYIFYTTFK